MSTLFLDTSYNQILGLLDNEGTWIAKKIKEGQKTSATLHADLHALCLENKIEPNAIKQVLYVAGPGFYTGLRIAYGMADMLKIEGRSLLNFYTYELPKFMGVTEYKWITKAYRGEVFIHHYLQGKGHSYLLADKEFLAKSWDGEIYIHHQNALDALMSEKLPQAKATEDILLNHMPQVWAAVHATKLDRELFYFRAPEEEFKPSV